MIHDLSIANHLQYLCTCTVGVVMEVTQLYVTCDMQTACASVSAIYMVTCSLFIDFEYYILQLAQNYITISVAKIATSSLN